MTPEPAPPYDLIDPRPIAKSAPYTFFLPGPAEMDAIRAGDIVKLIFEYPHETEKWGAERMWVIVDEVHANYMLGTLDNQPDEPTTKLKCGTVVRFARHHIIDIDWANPETAPPASVYPNDRQEYWARCIVDECVLDGDVQVEFIYREEPGPQKEAEYPDSGWRIRGRQGNASDEDMDARKRQYVALAAVLNKDDSWLYLIDSPVGTALLRCFETDTYFPDVSGD